MDAIRTQLRMLGANERGATAIEYGLICALIAVAAIGGVGGMWGKLLSNMNTYMH